MLTIGLQDGHERFAVRDTRIDLKNRLITLETKY